MSHPPDGSYVPPAPTARPAADDELSTLSLSLAASAERTGPRARLRDFRFSRTQAAICTAEVELEAATVRSGLASFSALALLALLAIGLSAGVKNSLMRLVGVRTGRTYRTHRTCRTNRIGTAPPAWSLVLTSCQVVLWWPGTMTHARATAVGGSGSGADVEKVRAATALVRERRRPAEQQVERGAQRGEAIA